MFASTPAKTQAVARGRIDTAQAARSSYGPEGPAIRPSLELLTAGHDAIVQRSGDDAIEEARRHHPAANYQTFEQVRANKNQFSAGQWRSIVDGYNRGTSEGARLRYTPPSPPPPVVAPRSTPAPTLSDHLDNAASASGYINTAASTLEHVVDNPVSNLLADVPVLGAVSSAKIARDKKAQAEQSYLRGDLGNAARHGVGSVASGIKSVSDATTVATGGLSAPLTVPISTTASLVNTATSVPEYLQTASTVASDPHRTLSLVATTIADAPDTASNIASSASSFASRVGSAFRGVTDLVGLTKSEREEPPPPSEEELARQREGAERLRQVRKAARAQRRAFANSLVGKPKQD